MLRLREFAACLCLAALVGCGEDHAAAYNGGYETGQDKGRLDQEISVEDGQLPAWTWDENGKGECPFVPGTAEYQDFQRGYKEGYADSGDGIYDPRPPGPRPAAADE